MEKTAMQQLMDKFTELKEKSDTVRDMIYLDGVLAVIEQYISIERRQIEEAFRDGGMDRMANYSQFKYAKDYFTTKYGTNG